MRDGALDWWPNCATPDCENKRCLWSGTDLCYPCAARKLGAEHMGNLYRATHPPEACAGD